MRTIVFTIALLCSVAQAGEVYKCKGPHGEITFTNTKCPDDTSAAHYGSYTNVPDAPPVADTNPEPAAAQRDAPPARDSAPAAIAGYFCEGNGRGWLQLAECPKTMNVEMPVDVDSSTDPFASGSITVKTPVQQTPLERADFCAKLATSPATSLHGKSAPSSGYDRNRMRSQVGC